MIYVRMIGGLGNQMFQYAAGRRLALHHKTNLTLDTSWFGTKDPSGAAVRTYELNCFAIEATPTDTPAANYEPSGRIGRVLHRLNLSGKRKIITESSLGFDPQILELPDGIVLNGYWQNDQYFKDVSDAIRADFNFVPKPSTQNIKMAAQIATTTAVSLHIRRGDYVASKVTNHYHGTSPLDYYYAAIKQLVAAVPNPTFYVFSDDPEWCKANLKLDYPTVFVDHNPPDKGYEDMRLMSLCQHHIIANSSFSWWGAWLGINPDKQVFAPKIWFKDEAANANHSLPKAWTRL